MSAFSTMEITREDAIKLINDHLNQMTAKELEETLFTLYTEKSAHNFQIVPDYNSDWHLKFKDHVMLVNRDIEDGKS